MSEGYQMNKEIHMYYIYDDGEGHRYLIPREVYRSFSKAITRVDESFDEHKDEDVYYEELDDVLSHFSKGCLEGEEYYVVLASELEGKV